MICGDRPALDVALTKQSSNLRFDSRDDALCFASDCVKRGNDWLALNEVNLAKHYVEGRCNIILDVRTDAYYHVGYLVFRRVPVVHTDSGGAPDRAGNVQTGPNGGGAYWDDRAMRIGVSHPVERTEQRIPSRVWFEASEQRPYVGWVSSQASTVKFSQDTGFVICEGEPCVARIAADKCDRAGIDSMVKSVSEVAGGVLDDAPNIGGELLSKADFVGLLAGLRVFVDNSGVWFSREERFDPRFCILNVFPASLDLQLGALEMVEGVVHA